MNHDKFDQIDRSSQSFRALASLLAIMQFSVFMMAAYSMLLGMLIIVGGPSLFSAIGDKAALYLTGGPASWGIVLLVAGMLAFFGLKNRQYMVGVWGMFISGTWCFAFGGAFLISSIQDLNSDLTAVQVLHEVVAFSKDGVLFIMMAMAQRILARVPTKREEEVRGGQR
mgnify:CR=1 FL=1